MTILLGSIADDYTGATEELEETARLFMLLQRELYTIVPKYFDTSPDLRHYCLRNRRGSWLAKRPENTIARASLSLN